MPEDDTVFTGADIEEAHKDARDYANERIARVNYLYDAYSSGETKSFSYYYRNSDSQDKVAFLHRLYEDGVVSEEQYRDFAAVTLTQARPESVFFFDDDELFEINPEDNTPQRIALFPQADNRGYNIAMSTDGSWINEGDTGLPMIVLNSDQANYVVGQLMGPMDDESTWVRNIRPVASFMVVSLFLLQPLVSLSSYTRFTT